MTKNGTVEKQVYSQDLKSCVARHGGSTPPSPTNEMHSGQSHQDKVQEILDITQEECAEVIQAISKCRRFGLDNSHKSGLTQRENLTQEIGDILCMIDLIMAHGIVDHTKVQQAKQAKTVKLAKWSNIFD